MKLHLQPFNPTFIFHALLVGNHFNPTFIFHALLVGKPFNPTFIFHALLVGIPFNPTFIFHALLVGNEAVAKFSESTKLTVICFPDCLSCISRRPSDAGVA